MGTIKCINICIMGVPEGEDKEEQKPYFKKWPKTIPKFNKRQKQTHPRSSNTSKKDIHNFPKDKNKRRILKAIRGEIYHI